MRENIISEVIREGGGRGEHNINIGNAMSCSVLYPDGQRIVDPSPPVVPAARLQPLAHFF